MRITLQWKITAILVAVGLVPALIVGWFAYKANDDYRNKQILVVRKTAETICARVSRHTPAKTQGRRRYHV